jgi:2-polyprenyl-3-methyl-5-hydroxy-6-metoxy-1,4-benzoquinol methylase
MLGAAREVLPKIPSNSYDLVVMMDVIEHFERDQGTALLRECQRIGTIVLISTPSVYWPQQDIFGNAHERHLSVWSARDFKSLGAVYVGRGENVIGVFAPPTYREHFAIRPYVRWAVDRFGEARAYLRGRVRDRARST